MWLLQGPGALAPRLMKRRIVVAVRRRFLKNPMDLYIKLRPEPSQGNHGTPCVALRLHLFYAAINIRYHLIVGSYQAGLREVQSRY